MARPSTPYDADLHALRIQLVRLQRHVIESGQRLLVVVEGRDGAGKDGIIKRIVKHLSPRETRVVALGKPSSRDEASWYFQRWVHHLPADGEIVLFNRSGYNRAGVEWVMGFCDAKEREAFLEDTPRFEDLLVRSGITLRKYYLDIGKAEQKRRLADRRKNPLKQWKVSPIDEVAVSHWRKYSEARDEMFLRTHTPSAPWIVVQADDKRVARVEMIKSLLGSVEYVGKHARRLAVDPKVVFTYGASSDERPIV